MDNIKSLKRLIETLKQSDAKDYVKIAKDMKIPVSDFTNYAHWKKDSYTRNCIIKTEDFELILICWKKNDFTPIHGHNNQKCWIYQVEGEMTEIRYEKDNDGNLIECNRMLLTPGKLCYMHDDMGYHLLENPTEANAMTLHIYIKPVERCEIYNDTTSSFENKVLSFDTIDGVIINKEIATS